MNAKADPLLKATKLSVSTLNGTGTKELVHDATFSVCRGEILVILGESGSGKTLLSRSLTKLFPHSFPMRIGGSVLFDGNEILELDPPGLSLIRRRSIRYVFQELILALNPLAKVRTQLRLSTGNGGVDDQFLIDMLSTVGLENPKSVLDLYPHQLSAGMAQRVCIAMAVLPSPSLLIADEPTSAVDASLRYMLLDLLMSIQRDRGMSMILITHDIDIARRYGDRIVVMYAGRIVELAERSAFFTQQLHPYSRLLVAAHAGGMIPAGGLMLSDDMTSADKGCRFQFRCPIVKNDCRESEPIMDHASGESEVRCPYWK